MLSALQIGHLEQIVGLRWSFWVRATSLIIEKRRFLAYSTFKTFSFGFKVYVNFIVVEFWLAILSDWLIVLISLIELQSFEMRYSGRVPLLHIANPFSIFKWWSSSCFCVSCSSSISCYFECVCNFVLTDSSRVVKRIKVVSRFVSLFLPVEIIRVIWYFVICSELCSIVLEIQISICKN